MAGLYIHIPFCKSRCIYCGFYSTTHTDMRQRYVDALCLEMASCHAAMKGESIGTVYFGGGTPSQLTPQQLEQLFDCIYKTYNIPPQTEEAPEITMECNPDDVTDEYAAALAKLPVNRVSMGAQTFSDRRLRFLRRRHSAQQIYEAVERLRRVGITNISIDLMYGFPDETLADWHHDIDSALALGATHLSAYALMYEEDTTLYRLLAQGKVQEADEELSLQMYADLIDRLTASGYEHYEISNFAKRLPCPSEGKDKGTPAHTYRSRHNSSYWQGVPYIGLGAAAHSYDGRACRQWNIDDVVQYIEGMEKGNPAVDREILDADTRYNERIMTALRTCEGLPLDTLSAGRRAYLMEQAQTFLTDGQLALADNHLRLTRRGLFISNMVMSSLMKV